MIAFTERAFRFLSTEVRGLQAAVYVLAVSALLSSLLALVRDRLLAHTFGASLTLDVYYAAFRIPDLIFVAIAALVSVYMLIPELSKREGDAQKSYIDTIIVGFSVLAIGVSAIAALFAPMLLSYLFPHFAQQGLDRELVTMTRIMLLQPILLGFSNIFAAITQARNRYALYALSPLLYNLGIILGVTAMYSAWGLIGLAWGVVLGAALHLLIQIPSVVSDGFLARIPKLREPKALVRTAILSVPRALTLSMNQLAFLGLTVLAATLSAGSITVFMFAYNLQAVPLAVIGASYSVAAFPTLARAYTRGDREEFVSLVAAAARYVFFWSLPIAALIIVLRAHIVRVVLGSGAFDWTDTRLTAAAFALFSVSLAAQGISLLLIRGYYAAGRTFVPLAIAVGSGILMLVLGYLSLHALENSFLFESMQQFLRVDEVGGSRVLALAFAYACASIFSALALAIHFEYAFRGFFAGISRTFLESLIATVAAGASAYIFLEYATYLQISSTSLSIFLQGFLAGIGGVMVAALAYYLLGSREYTETYVSLAGRLWRKREKDEVTLAASAESDQPST